MSRIRGSPVRDWTNGAVSQGLGIVLPRIVWFEGDGHGVRCHASALSRRLSSREAEVWVLYLRWALFSFGDYSINTTIPDGFIKASPATKRAVLETVEELRKQGHECIEFTPPSGAQVVIPMCLSSVLMLV